MTDVTIGVSPARRRPLACLRCRRRKVRCDGASPACSNCARAGAECFEGKSDSAISRSRLHYLENRVRELESQAANSQTPTTGYQELRPENVGPQPIAYPNNYTSDYQPQQQSNQAHVSDQLGERTIQQPRQQSSFQSPAGQRFTGGQSHAPVAVEDPRSSNFTSDAAVPSPASSHITGSHPVVHEVGLLSLSNAIDPKYLGPSSGVTLARFIYESVPQSQGLPSSYTAARENEQGQTDRSHNSDLCNIRHIDFPSMADCQQYAEAYFSMSTFYPFISQEDFYSLFHQAFQFNKTSTWNCHLPLALILAQIYLVLSLGARFLEFKLGNAFPSQDLFYKSMGYASKIKLHESIEGVQVLLLLAQHSFFCPEGLNAWYLVHTIIASCLDLGLQRRENVDPENETASQRKTRHLRSAIFWSAYSMDRTLTVVLGRPLTLRDEAIDQEFPGFGSNYEVESGAMEWKPINPDSPSSHLASTPYTAFIYSLRFDRIIAEIKLMLYRVSRSPSRFPWPQDLSAWRQEAQTACAALIEEAQTLQQGHIVDPRSTLSAVTLQRLELKYHQCIMLLNRPSPQNPHPTLEAMQESLRSAMGTICTYAELHRFSNMEFSWLSAHSIFVASITVIYCLWSSPFVGGDDTLDSCLHRVEQAQQLLKTLGKYWSVALEASSKLERLARSTKELYEIMGDSQATDRAGNATASWMNAILGIQGPSQAGDDRPAMNNIPVDGGHALIDELGVLRDLFDLGWLENLAPNNNET